MIFYMCKGSLELNLQSNSCHQNRCHHFSSSVRMTYLRVHAHRWTRACGVKYGSIFAPRNHRRWVQPHIHTNNKMQLYVGTCSSEPKHADKSVPLDTNRQHLGEDVCKCMHVYTYPRAAISGLRVFNTSSLYLFITVNEKKVQALHRL